MNRGKRKKLRAAESVGLIVMGGIFLFSAYKIGSYCWELYCSRHGTNEVQAECVSSVEGEPAIKVDFGALQKINSDIIAWIYCPDTQINYPVVQGKDNEYYLNHLLDGSYNANGTLFMDYRCVPDDRNTIIYGHNMRSGNMFGELVNYKRQAFYNKHPVMYLFTPDASYKLHLFAGVVVDSESLVYSAEPSEGGLTLWKDCSTFQSNVTVLPEDKLVTLSTCSYEYDNARYVVMATMEKL